MLSFLIPKPPVPAVPNAVHSASKEAFFRRAKTIYSKSKCYIQYIQYHGGIAHFGYELADIGARTFRL